MASFLKKILRIKRSLVVTPEGNFFVDPLSNFGYELSSKGGYEPAMVKVVKHILKNGDIFLDIGANEGYFSVIASKSVGESGRIFALSHRVVFKVFFLEISRKTSHIMSM